MATRQPGGRGRGARARRPGAPIVRRGTLRITHEVARHIRAGHPWIYREELGHRVMRERPGAPIEVVDEDGDFVARGVFDGEHGIALDVISRPLPRDAIDPRRASAVIAVRLMTRDPREQIGPELVAARVRGALAFRRRMFDFDEYQALRLINGEHDGLPAMVVDRYGDYLVVQLFASAVEGFRDALYDALEAELAPRGIYEQKRYRSLAGDAPPRAAAELVRGQAAPVELEVREGVLKFHADVTAPLSTGLFADLREGRRAVAGWSKERRVLNLFSYTGAISVYAAHGGASAITAVDVAAKAHARARRNFAVNGFDPEKPEHIVGDAFKVLARFAERGRRFDMVAIDPPAFASASRGGKAWSAVKDYSELVGAALAVLEPGGILASASSTHKLSQLEFELALAEGAVRAKTALRIVERRSFPPDFPTLPGFPEGNYLKFVVAIRD